MPAVSIIVPVYKVEKYLNRCVDSILCQTFRDYELILVDDGSPDNCGKICDEYAKKDKRVVVIHKENGGLSDARNKGIDWASENSDSNYIIFVDSDDYIRDDLLEKCINKFNDTNADIICFGVEMVDEQLNQLQWGTMNIVKEKDFSYNDRFAPLVAPDFIGDYAYNKMYRKKLLNDIRYPFGKNYEDIYTTYKIFDKAQHIVIIPYNMYYYVRRIGSITNDKKLCKNTLNYYHASKEKYYFIIGKEAQFSDRAVVFLVNSIKIVAGYFVNYKIYKSNKDLFNDLIENIKKNYESILRSKYLNKEDYVFCERILNGIRSYIKYSKIKKIKGKLFGLEDSFVSFLIKLKNKFIRKNV